MLAAQPPQLVDEPPPVRVERGLVRRAGDTAPAIHEHVEVGGERHPAQAPPPVPAEDEGVEVVVVDVAVGEAHRLAAVRAHDRQGLGVVVGVEQADLAADELGVRPRSADVAQQTHLCGHPGEGVRPVDAHLVGVARVVAGRAGEVAAREDPVCPFAATPWRPSTWPGVRTISGSPAQRRASAARNAGSTGRVRRSASRSAAANRRATCWTRSIGCEEGTVREPAGTSGSFQAHTVGAGLPGSAPFCPRALRSSTPPRRTTPRDRRQQIPRLSVKLAVASQPRVRRRRPARGALECRQRRFLARRGQYAGRLDPRYVR